MDNKKWIIIAASILIVVTLGLIGLGVGSTIRDKVKTEQLSETEDFILKISADKQVYTENEEIYIDIILENRSGVDMEIAYYFLFYPESSTGQFPAYEISPITTKKLFKNGETIRETARLGGCFPVGQHELKYKAVFYLSWEMTEFGYEKVGGNVDVYSNTIKLSVIES